QAADDVRSARKVPVTGRDVRLAQRLPGGEDLLVGVVRVRHRGEAGVGGQTVHRRRELVLRTGRHGRDLRLRHLRPEVDQVQRQVLVGEAGRVVQVRQLHIDRGLVQRVVADLRARRRLRPRGPRGPDADGDGVAVVAGELAAGDTADG